TIQHQRVSERESDLRPGIGCCLVHNYLYSLALFPSKDRKGFDSPVGVARIHQKRLAAFDGRGWEYWSQGASGPHWSDKPEKLFPSFRDAAPEMTIGHVRGIPGFVAVYTLLGLGKDIMIRHAELPEGPWSKPLRLYHCPEADKKVFTYAGKFHPELSARDG